ncbi:MAG: mechanosensitive ion channel domain-containing protein [Litorimonas sp.]
MRVFITYFCSLSVLVLTLSFGVMAYAQDTAPPNHTSEPAAQTETLQVETSEQSVSEEPPLIPPTIDEQDDIQAKIDAADEAQKQAYEALRQKYETGQTPVLDTGDGVVLDAVDSPAKPSVIPKSMDDVKALGNKLLGKILGWLKSPAFLAQLAAVFLAWFLSPMLTKSVKKRVVLFRDAPVEGAKLKVVRDYVYRSREFLRAAFQVLLLTVFAIILKNIPSLGQDWLVKLAQGLAVVFLLYSVIKTFITNEMIQKLAIWITIPIALLMVFGYFDNLTNFLRGTELMRMGDTPITLMTVLQLGIFGALFFKLGGIANDKGQKAIRSQESLDSSTREVVSKIFQILLFGIIFILVMSAAKVPLSGLVVIFSALSLGIGLGLQPVAANFVSGMIILFDRSVRVGDFVSLDDGREGFVEAINMRSTTVETTDGKDIMVPNTTFVENAYENWTHKDPRQRYEVYFSVAYDTDLDSLEDIVIPVFTNHPSVLDEPEKPDLELREFASSGINFAVEFWCSGIDDGPNKFTSDLNFAIWRVLRDNNIRMPLPQTEVRLLK